MLKAGMSVMLALLLAAPAQADAALDKLMASAKAAPVLGFNRTANIEFPGKPAVKRVDRFDPKAREGQQWTLVSLNGRAPTADERKDYQKQVKAQPTPGFHRLPILLQGQPTAIEPHGKTVVYRWAKLVKGAAPSGQGPDISEKLSAEATVSMETGTPVLQKVRIYAAKPFSVMAVAKMNRFEAVTHYQHHAGLHHLERQSTEVDAKIPFRPAGIMRTAASFTAP